VCPTCGLAGVEIVYGYPGVDLFDAAERGEIALGGCVPSPETHQCPNGHAFLARRGPLTHHDPSAPSVAELKATDCWFPVDQVPKRPDVTAFKRQARLHQATWRQARGFGMGSQPIVGGPDAKPVGSRVPLAVAQETGVNFLSHAVRAAVRWRLDHPEKHQMLQEPRLWADLLSSMPMCFNLFGELHADPAAADTAVHAWWPDTPGRVTATRFEWSPGRLDPQYLGNRSAFDVAFELEPPDGTRGVVGVETKYHEHAAREPAPKPERLARYLEVTERSHAFGPGAVQRLVGTDLQQIWLDHLLALSMLQHPTGRWTWARFVLVAPGGNPSFHDAAERYRDLLADPSTFAFCTIEQLLDAPGALPATLVDDFRKRYLW
jgi:hypothetical protein